MLSHGYPGLLTSAFFLRVALPPHPRPVSSRSAFRAGRAPSSHERHRPLQRCLVRYVVALLHGLLTAFFGLLACSGVSLLIATSGSTPGPRCTNASRAGITANGRASPLASRDPLLSTIRYRGTSDFLSSLLCSRRSVDVILAGQKPLHGDPITPRRVRLLLALRACIPSLRVDGPDGIFCPLRRRVHYSVGHPRLFSRCAMRTLCGL